MLIPEVHSDTPYFIDNKFVKSETTSFIELHDPATNNLVTRVPQSTDAELKMAVESAKKAFPAWRATSVMARQQVGLFLGFEPKVWYSSCWVDYVQVHTIGSRKLG